MYSNDEPIRILMVGEEREARSLCDLLESSHTCEFRVMQVGGIASAAEYLRSEKADVLLLNLGSDQVEGRGATRAVCSAFTSLPTVILSELESDSLAIESLQQGAQDFISKHRLDVKTLARSLRFAIERHRLQRALQTLSLIDDLTGLHNRRGFLALAEQQLRLIQRKGSALLLYIDLDDLKGVNDAYGHLEGNRALIEVAHILRASFRQSDILARIGGDEFCVLMTDAVHDSAAQVRKRLQQRLDFSNALTTARFRLSLSVGIADVPAVRQPPLEELLRLADALMYEQKRGRRSASSAPASLKQSTTA